MSFESVHIFERILYDITSSGHGDLASSAVCLWADDQFLVYPPVHGGSPFWSAICSLGTRVAVKTKTFTVELALLDASRADAQYLDIDSETRIYIVESFRDLASLRQVARAALVRDEGVIVVWADIVDTISTSCNQLEARLTHYVAQRARTLAPADTDSHLVDEDMLRFINWSGLELLPELPAEPQATQSEGELPITSPLPAGYWLGVEMSSPVTTSRPARARVRARSSGGTATSMTVPESQASTVTMRSSGTWAPSTT
ncbi:hypothetical protein B0H21DRAFT_894635 [Amylocystis lapponica]|nr:hypothetical protein B0H21DRAFT_894635 [Amylocystis lapponica]